MLIEIFSQNTPLVTFLLLVLAILLGVKATNQNEMKK